MLNKSWGRYALILLPMMLGAVGCGPTQKAGLYPDTRVLTEGDDFNWLQMKAGVEPEDMLVSQEITVQGARNQRAWIQFLVQDGHMASYGPRRTVEFCMEEIIAGGRPMPRSILIQRLERFRGRYVLRMDGYVVGALSGKPLQSVGPLRMEKGGIFGAGLRQGVFYLLEGNTLREDPALVIPPSPTGIKVSMVQ